MIPHLSIDLEFQIFQLKKGSKTLIVSCTIPEYNFYLYIYRTPIAAKSGLSMCCITHIPYFLCSRVISGPPVTTESRERFESGFGHFEEFRKNESLCPSRKWGPNPGEAKIQNGRRRPSWKYQNLLS